MIRNSNVQNRSARKIQKLKIKRNRGVQNLNIPSSNCNIIYRILKYTRNSNIQKLNIQNSEIRHRNIVWYIDEYRVVNYPFKERFCLKSVKTQPLKLS